MKKIIIVIIFLTALCSYVYADKSCSHETDEPKCEEKDESQKLGLEIINFAEDSNLKKVGAQTGDIIIRYNNVKVGCINHLGELKEAASTPNVEVVFKRNDEEISVTIPKGKIGVYLQEVVPEHKIDEDAVIIKNIGKLGWNLNMDNSFLGTVFRIEEKFDQQTSYEDIMGLSGYAFRLQFFDEWCPSSPDATCGKDLGSEILTKLGYTFEVYNGQCPFPSEELAKSAKTDDEIRQIMMKSIDSGWPVIAIDLIQVPEWSIVTGYQKDGKEFFCRTYFDKTKGYEIAQKTPWVIFVITDKKDVDIFPEYDNSLLLAKELYQTEKYDNYFSGIKAIEEWIKALNDEKHFEELDDAQFDETVLANWWIYYSLISARNYAKKYLLNNLDKFDYDEELLNELAKIYENETEILQNGLQYVPSAQNVKSRSDWNKEMRENQTKFLEEFLEIEKNANNILNKIK